MIKQRALGPYSVSAIGMGCMPLSFPHDRDPLGQPCDELLGLIWVRLLIVARIFEFALKNL